MTDPVEAGATGRRPRGSTPAVAPVGTAEQATQGATDPVVLGAAPVPVEPGGPGAGAARTAEATEAVVSQPLTGAAEAALGLRPAGAADALTATERSELEGLRRLRDGGGLVVDAARMPGRRTAQAATQIMRDGRGYAVGEPIALDFGSYTELVGIGAIVNVPWSDLPMAGGE
ncbi:hypothetical protein [Methylobacterium aquaticum]|uniref:hypothetical protein n=1 Tax=Methylobacterium aquaticum TaxID=270351 RepID=UPI0019318D4C|nr:hypothetical protein [Methylobacterium aquaticum]QRE74388.1 hypothetical protein F1D61_12930 [Methylobacterium aquaticum]